MEIRNNHPSYAPHFGILLKRESVLEAASGHLFYHSGIDGFREVFVALGNKKATGHFGFMKHAILIGEKINSKYSEIQKASSEIKEIVKNNPNISKEDLSKQVQHIVDKFNPTIDITL